MHRMTTKFSDDIYNKLTQYAEANGLSMSNAIAKLTEMGLLVAQYQEQNQSKVTLNPVEEHCYKLIMQMNALLKNIAKSQLEMSDETLDLIRDASEKRLQILLGSDDKND